MKTKIIATLVVVFGLGGFAYYKMQSGNTAPVTIDNTGTTLAPKETTNPGNMMGGTPMMNNKKYKDGTYTVVGNYQAPSGDEHVNVTLVIKDDKVTSATVVGDGRGGNTGRFQDRFIAGFSGYVVGKSIDAIDLTVVNGSSLTPNGFMDALSQIQSQAKA